MKIGIDCRSALARKTGDRTYLLGLLQGLAQSTEVGSLRFELLLDRPDEAGVLPPAPHFAPVVLQAPNSRLWTLWTLPRYARLVGLDLVHVQYLAPRLLPCPYITTIHDTVWRALPATFPKRDRAVMNLAMPGTARRAASIICGSDAARADIARYLRVPPAKIEVTPYALEPRYLEPVAPEAVAAVRARYSLGQEPYVLSVGVLQPRKNLPRLIAAFAQVKAQHPDWPHRLVVVGKEGWGSSPAAVNATLAAAPGAEPIYTGYVGDDELPALYAGAACFAYPSLYEGFGYPILEAMACGAPVLTSGVSSMREVAGDAAELVEPRDIGSIARGLEHLLGDAEYAAELVQHGRSRATLYTPERQAAATLEVYRKVLGVV